MGYGIRRNPIKEHAHSAPGGTGDGAPIDGVGLRALLEPEADSERIVDDAIGDGRVRDVEEGQPLRTRRIPQDDAVGEEYVMASGLGDRPISAPAPEIRPVDGDIGRAHHVDRIEERPIPVHRAAHKGDVSSLRAEVDPSSARTGDDVAMEGRRGRALDVNGGARQPADGQRTAQDGIAGRVGDHVHGETVLPQQGARLDGIRGSLREIQGFRFGPAARDGAQADGVQVRAGAEPERGPARVVHKAIGDRIGGRVLQVETALPSRRGGESTVADRIPAAVEAQASGVAQGVRKPALRDGIRGGAGQPQRIVPRPGDSRDGFADRVAISPDVETQAVAYTGGDMDSGDRVIRRRVSQIERRVPRGPGRDRAPAHGIVIGASVDISRPPQGIGHEAARHRVRRGVYDAQGIIAASSPVGGQDGTIHHVMVRAGVQKKRSAGRVLDAAFQNGVGGGADSVQRVDARRAARHRAGADAVIARVDQVSPISGRVRENPALHGIRGGVAQEERRGYGAVGRGRGVGESRSHAPLEVESVAGLDRDGGVLHRAPARDRYPRLVSRGEPIDDHAADRHIGGGGLHAVGDPRQAEIDLEIGESHAVVEYPERRGGIGRRLHRRHGVRGEGGVLGDGDAVPVVDEPFHRDLLEIGQGVPEDQTGVLVQYPGQAPHRALEIGELARAALLHIEDHPTAGRQSRGLGCLG